jgi:hypothetical protein
LSFFTSAGVTSDAGADAMAACRSLQQEHVSRRGLAFWRDDRHKRAAQNAAAPRSTAGFCGAGVSAHQSCKAGGSSSEPQTQSAGAAMPPPPPHVTAAAASATAAQPAEVRRLRRTRAAPPPMRRSVSASLGHALRDRRGCVAARAARQLDAHRR